MIKTLIATASALALTATPALAAASAPVSAASTLSLKGAVRTGTPTARKGKLAAPDALVGLILAAAVVAGGILIVADDSDSN